MYLIEINHKPSLHRETPEEQAWLTQLIFAGLRDSAVASGLGATTVDETLCLPLFRGACVPLQPPPQ